MSKEVQKSAAFAGLGDNLSAIVEVNLEDLKRLAGHPWSIDKSGIQRTKAIVTRYGDRALPILVDDDNGIVSGEIFVEAARAVGRKTIRVIRQSGLTRSEALLLGTALSKIQTLGDFDGAAMEAALREFESQIEDFCADLIGFAPGELDRLIGASTMPPEADALPRLARQPVSWPGIIWRCGEHLVLCGDATSPEAMDMLLAGQRVSVAICDPPFGCKVDGFVSSRGKHREFVQASGEMDDAALSDFFSRFCTNLASVLLSGGLAYLFIDWRSLGLLQRAAEAVFGKLVNLCVWTKDRAGMGSFYRSQHELVLLFSAPGARVLSEQRGWVAFERATASFALKFQGKRQQIRERAEAHRGTDSSVSLPYPIDLTIP